MCSRRKTIDPVREHFAGGFHGDCRRAYATFNSDHRCYEGHWIRVSDGLDPHALCLDFPGVAFEPQIRRETQIVSSDQRREPETVYLLTSLPTEEATPRRLLQFNCGNWGAVKNGVHWIRDRVLGKDGCRTRNGLLPRMLAALSNAAVSIHRMLGVENLQDPMDCLHLRPDASAQIVAG